MQVKKDWDTAAIQIVEQRKSLTPITPLGQGLTPLDQREGYDLQSHVNQLLRLDLGDVVGHKIGCTTPVMQKFLNIPGACAGEIFSQTAFSKNLTVPRGRFIKLGVECEIVVSLAKTISPSTYSPSSFSAHEVIGALMVGMEIVDDRYKNYESIGVPTLIADNFFDCGCVLGKEFFAWKQLDLNGLRGTTKVNGTVVGSGRGELIMGAPLNALRWFVHMSMERGKVLQKGQFVMLGSVVETKWLASKDYAEVEIEELGSISLTVE